MIDGLPYQVIRTVVKAFPAIRPHLSEAALKVADGFPGIRADLYSAVYEAVSGYLSGSGYITTYKAQMATAVSQAYVETADAAYQEGGGELPLDDETAAWARGQLDQQLAYVDQLFEHLKELRKEGADPDAEALARAQGYASGLDGFYNEAVLRGSKNQSVVWVLGSTEKHCKTCASLDGKRHRISWFIEHDYIPRKNGAAMDCGGYNCDCRLVDKDGNEVTI